MSNTNINTYIKAQLKLGNCLCGYYINGPRCKGMIVNFDNETVILQLRDYDMGYYCEQFPIELIGVNHTNSEYNTRWYFSSRERNMIMMKEGLL